MRARSSSTKVRSRKGWPLPGTDYKGYLLTPHTSPVEDYQTGARLWSVGVFIRTKSQAEEENRHFRLKGVFVNSKFEAFNQALSFGKRLVNEDLSSWVQRHASSPYPKPQEPVLPARFSPHGVGIG